MVAACVRVYRSVTESGCRADCEEEEKCGVEV